MLRCMDPYRDEWDMSVLLRGSPHRPSSPLLPPYGTLSTRGAPQDLSLLLLSPVLLLLQKGLFFLMVSIIKLYSQFYFLVCSPEFSLAFPQNQCVPRPTSSSQVLPSSVRLGPGFLFSPKPPNLETIIGHTLLFCLCPEISVHVSSDLPIDSFLLYLLYCIRSAWCWWAPSGLSPPSEPCTSKPTSPSLNPT